MGQVVITGSTGGIALSLAKLHLERQNQVWVCVRYISLELMQLASENTDYLHICRCDLSDAGSVKSVFQHLSTYNKRIDTLYILPGTEDEEKGRTDIKNYLSIYNRNALGMLRVLQYSFPLISEGTVILHLAPKRAEDDKSCGYEMAEAAAEAALRFCYPEYKRKGVYLLGINREDLEDTDFWEDNGCSLAERIVKIAENPESIENR